MGTQAERRRPSLVEAVRSQAQALAGVAVLTAAIASVAPLASIASDGRIGADDLMSDPAELTGEPWYLGVISSTTMLFWAAAAAVHLTATLGLRRSDRRLAAALGCLGMVTVIVMLDDLLLLHEIFVPWMIGLPEAVTFALYGVLLAAVLVAFRVELAACPEAVVLAVAVGALGGSVGLDVLGWDIEGRRVAEETLKLAGAVAWAAFPVALVVRQLDRSPQRGHGPPRPA